MATPPTFVGEYESTWTTTSSGTAKTASVTVSTGDLLVIGGVTEQQGVTIGTPTGGGLTYTLRQSTTGLVNYCITYVWTAPCPAGQTFTLSLTSGGGSGLWGWNALQFGSNGGVGASSKTNANNAAPSLGLTTTGDNSAIVCFNGDWNAADGTSRTWRTVNSITPTSGNGLERTYFRDSSFYTTYGAYWSDAGATGAKTVGLSAPSTQKYAVVAVEVLGTTSAAVSDSPIVPRRAAHLAALLDM